MGKKMVAYLGSSCSITFPLCILALYCICLLDYLKFCNGAHTKSLKKSITEGEIEEGTKPLDKTPAETTSYRLKLPSEVELPSADEVAQTNRTFS